MNRLPTPLERTARICNSVGEPCALRFGLSRTFVLHIAHDSPDESRPPPGPRLKELVTDGTSLLYSLPAHIAASLWQNWKSGFSREQADNECLWLDALFELSWQGEPGSVLYATRSTWHGNVSVQLDGNGLFPQLTDIYPPSVVKSIPHDHGHPMAYYSRLPDVARASVAAIDAVLQRGSLAADLPSPPQAQYAEDSDMEDTKKQLLKTLAARVAKGGAKSIPIIGGVLEEAIFGVMDAESARRESAKLHCTLQSIQNSVDAQTQTLEQLLGLARDQAELDQTVKQAIDQVLRRTSSADGEDELAADLDRVAARHEIDLSSFGSDAEAAEQGLQEQLRPQVMNRASLIRKLSELSHGDIDVLVASLGAYGIPSKSSNRKSRAAKLVEWAQRPDGDGLAEVILAARELEISGFEKAIPDPQ